MSADRPGRRRRRDPHRRPRLPRARTEPVGPLAAQAASRCRPRAGTPRCRRRPSRRRDHRRGRQPLRHRRRSRCGPRAPPGHRRRGLPRPAARESAPARSRTSMERVPRPSRSEPPTRRRGAKTAWLPAPAEHPPIRIATTTALVRRDRGIQPSIRPERVPPYRRPRPCAMERETRFELATSTLGRWRSAS